MGIMSQTLRLAHRGQGGRVRLCTSADMEGDGLFTDSLTQKETDG